MELINFSKMHGAGNDFIICKAEDISGIDYSYLAKKVCDRHFGIGADGLMVVEASQVSDIKMNYFNSDGSIGEMCGNGIRCFSKFVYEKGILCKEVFTVETLAGEKKIRLKISGDGKVDKILVDMGIPSLDPKDVPVITDKKTFVNEDVSLKDSSYTLSSILMGVPHTIVFVKEIKEEEVYSIGPKIEKLDIYIRNTNVNFVEVVNEKYIKVDTWERGSGRTLACGTGVCASVFVANLLDYVGKKVEVSVPGGRLYIHIEKDNKVIMEGGAEFIGDGKYYL